MVTQGELDIMNKGHDMPVGHLRRVFISLTFRDMMAERDLLVSYVFG